MAVTTAKPSTSSVRARLNTPNSVVAELANVSQSFGSQLVLRNLSLKLHRGETLVVIGESGCGKSVTTKLLAGLMQPTSGEVLWDGRPVHQRNRQELHQSRLRLGYLFQGAALFDSMTVLDNIAFGLRENTTLPESKIREIVLDRLKEVGLDAAAANKNPADLSGGMRKRVGLARALAMSPDIMIYDEPTTGLDPVMSGVINQLILQTQQRRNVSSIVVTHDVTTVRQVANRIVMLTPLKHLAPDDSQIAFEGTWETLQTGQNLRVNRFVNGESEPERIA